MADRQSATKLERALDFALGLLNKDEERALLAEAREDPELEALIQQQCANRENARGEGLPTTISLSGTNRRRVGLRRPQILVAGSLLAATLAFFFLVQPRRQPASYWLPVTEVVNIQRSAEGDGVVLRTGLDLYAAHDLTAAIAALEQAPVQGALGDLRNLYLASALLNSGHRQEARQVLGRVDVPSLPYPWRERAENLQRLSGSGRTED